MQDHKDIDKYRDIWASVYRDFKRQHPYLDEQVVDWYPSGQREISVILDDNSKYCHELGSSTLRRIYSVNDNNENYIDEYDWRIEFSNNLRRKMFKYAMSQDELSERTGISHVTISKYLNCRATPNGYNIDLMARALHCSVSELMNIR